jgi:hypothetical protein
MHDLPDEQSKAVVQASPAPPSELDGQLGGAGTCALGACWTNVPPSAVVWAGDPLEQATGARARAKKSKEARIPLDSARRVPGKIA